MGAVDQCGGGETPERAKETGSGRSANGKVGFWGSEQARVD